MIVSWRAAAGLDLRVVPQEWTGGPLPIGDSLELFADQAGPAYMLAVTPAVDEHDTPPPAPVAEAGSGPGPGPSGGPRVELAETHVTLDHRGRLWGVTRFDLLAGEPLVRVKLPPGMRLFDLFVDGRAATDATPARSARDHVWEIRLLDVRWPRAIVAVFAGEINLAEALGRGTSLAGPTVMDLPCVQTVWTLECPRGLALEVGQPGKVVAASDLLAIRRVAIERLETDFPKPGGEAGPEISLRVQDFLERRRREALSPLLAQWRRSMPPDGAAPQDTAPPLCITLGSAPAEVRLRLRRQIDPSLPGRLLATCALGICAGVIWWMNRRSAAAVESTETMPEGAVTQVSPSPVTPAATAATPQSQSRPRV